MIGPDPGSLFVGCDGLDNTITLRNGSVLEVFLPNHACFCSEIVNRSESVSLSGREKEESHDEVTTRHDDHAPWPEEPDGQGPSLMSIEMNPEGNPASYLYWTASANTHGTPFCLDLHPCC